MANARSFSRLTDAQTALLVSAALFIVGAWPLALVEVPPFQDLPNHLATATVIDNLDRYPEYVFNGYAKTNAALFAWFHLVGKVTGVKLAARLFALLTLALSAFVVPRFVLRFTGSRTRMLVASLFAWPMIHNWFVCAGMLDFALAVPLSLALLVALDQHRSSPSPRLGTAGAIVALGVATWYAHVFPLLVVFLLVAIEVYGRPTWRERLELGRSFAIPLGPIALLVLASLVQHAGDKVGPMTGYMDFRKVLVPWELLYNAWAEWFWGYSNLTLTSAVPCVALAIMGLRALRRSTTPRPAFFSGRALLVLAILYCFVPYKITNWFHVNSRFLPYLWFGLLLYVPERLPKVAASALGVSALLYSLGMGADYVRLDADRKELTAGIDAVPEGARLLPLFFEHKGASVNTRNVLHQWGYYVVDKRTAAPLLFAHSRSFPVTYREPPPVRLNHLVLEPFAYEARTPAAVCSTSVHVDECDVLFRRAWETFFSEAAPRYDHLLVWAPTTDALALIPDAYERTFTRGRLSIYARRAERP